MPWPIFHNTDKDCHAQRQFHLKTFYAQLASLKEHEDLLVHFHTMYEYKFIVVNLP